MGSLLPIACFLVMGHRGRDMGGWGAGVGMWSDGNIGILCQIWCIGIWKWGWFKQNKKLFMNNRQESVYALSSRGYYQTTRPSNHPTITLANEKNVHLSYITCNQIFRGQSSFRNPQAELFCRESRSLPSKSHMFKSEITEATTNGNDDHTKNAHDLRISTTYNRREPRLISTSFHSGGSRLRIESPNVVYRSRVGDEKPTYQYEQTNKLEIPKTLEQFKTFKSDTLIREINKNQGYNSNKQQLKLIKTLHEGAKQLENSYHLSQLSKSHVSTQQPTQTQLPVKQNIDGNDEKKEIKVQLNTFRKEKESITLNDSRKTYNQPIYTQTPQIKVYQAQTPQKLPPSPPTIPNSHQTPQHHAISPGQDQQIQTPYKQPIILQSNCKQLSSSLQIGKTPSTISSYAVRHTPADWASTPRQQYVQESPRTPLYVNPELDELARLRQELAKRDKQLSQCKKSLEASQKKTKALQLQLQKSKTPITSTTITRLPTPTNKSVIISYPTQSSYNTSHELSKQLGGPVNALLYFTLFIVLLSKEMTGN